MIFTPKNLTEIPGKFSFKEMVKAQAHKCLIKDVLISFWKNFSYACAEIQMQETDTLLFRIGDVAPIPLDNYDYTIRILESGVCLCANTEQDLIRAYMTLLDRIELVDTADGPCLELQCCEIRETPLIKNRMIHFCVFHETELWELEKFVRLCGALKYTHIILEFWGSLQYSCMAELSWPNAFTKEDIKPIILLANDLGIEVVPMFNHWGHASGCRMVHGKHVMLDQNPALQTYFSEDGWCWDISKEKVRKLLKEVRMELMELCGEGTYFHIGCDEAYNFVFTPESMEIMCNYFNEIAEEMKAVGRKAILWGDMFLFRHSTYNQKNRYSCNAPSAEAETYMLSKLSRDLVIADWQYECKEAPVETALLFQKEGFTCMLCPWDRGGETVLSCASTVIENQLFGMMHTTWHTLSGGMPHVLIAAASGFEKVNRPEKYATYTAALMRKVCPVHGDYRKAGWGKFDIRVIA